MTHALDDHGVLGNAIKDEVGIRADQHAPDARNVGLLSDMRMLDEQSRDALHPLEDATGALRRFLRDGVDDFFYLPDRALGEAELRETGLAQRALISASVASSPRAISASASARSARSSAVKRMTGWSSPAS
jgi:hypothetical protein